MVQSQLQRPTLAAIVKSGSGDRRRAVSAAIAAVLVGAIIIMAAAVAYVTFPNNHTTTIIQTTSTQSIASQVYNLAGATTGYDHFNPGTTYTAGTNFNTLWDAYVNGAYQEIGSNTQTLSIQPSYGGALYAVVTVPSGQNYYVDAYDSQTKNSPLVSSWQYTSVANNGIDNFVFKLSNLPGSTNPISPLDFYPYFIAQATQTLNTPSAISSIGTSAATEFIQWSSTVPSGTANVGSMIKEITIGVNSSNAAVFALNSVNDPANLNQQGTNPSGLIQGSQFTPQQGSSSYTYTYMIGSSITDPSTGQFVTYATNSLDSFPYTMSGTFNFGATSGVNCLAITLTVYVLSAQGVVSTLTNAVNVASGSVC